MEVIPERGDIWGGMGSGARFGDSQYTFLHCDVGESTQRKAKDGDRRPAVELDERQPADSDADLMRRATTCGSN